MPIIATSLLTGDTVTLSEDGEWSGNDKVLLALARSTRLEISEQYFPDRILALAQAFARMLPGVELEERDRPEPESIPDGSVP